MVQIKFISTKMKDQLKIALIQAPLVWENPEANRHYFESKLADINEGVDMVILPEMFTTGFTMTPQNIHGSEGENTIVWMKKLAQKQNAAIVGSIVYEAREVFTNRLFFVKPDGGIDYYDKRHTFTLAGENEIYNSGAKKLIVNFRGFKICPMVCYDLRFPVWARNVEKYDVLLYAANWPKPRVGAWDALLRARAIENMAYCIGVNRVGVDEKGHEYSGHSAVYDCLGEQLAYSEKEAILYSIIERNHIEETREKLKFLEDMDAFTLE